jgi:hypothetical protein
MLETQSFPCLRFPAIVGQSLESQCSNRSLWRSGFFFPIPLDCQPEKAQSPLRPTVCQGHYGMQCRTRSPRQCRYPKQARHDRPDTALIQPLTFWPVTNGSRDRVGLGVAGLLRRLVTY